MNHPTPEKLRTTITQMDSAAQSAFSEIASMARLALLAMEQPSTYANGCGLDAIAHMLTAIKDMADDIQNCINVEAEAVGCNHVDLAHRRRWAAKRKATDSTVDGRAES